MQIIESIDRWREIFKKLAASETSVGFVPTMGALHAGHLSLIDRSVRENEVTAVSIYVNPTQFNNAGDLAAYPETWDEDVKALEKAGVAYLLHPSYNDMYRDAYRYKIIETDYSRDLCGAARPGHFDGVLTVVMKLLNITRAEKAYFGEKDWQQYRLISGMAEAFFVDTEIVPCSLIREESGLALSSRNKLLTAENKKTAPLFYKTISSGKTLDEMRKDLETAGFVIDYLKIKENRLFGAVFLGEVRLIDNVAV